MSGRNPTGLAPVMFHGMASLKVACVSYVFAKFVASGRPVSCAADPGGALAFQMGCVGLAECPILGRHALDLPQYRPAKVGRSAPGGHTRAGGSHVGARLFAWGGVSLRGALTQVGSDAIP